MLPTMVRYVLQYTKETQCDPSSVEHWSKSLALISTDPDVDIGFKSSHLSTLKPIKPIKTLKFVCEGDTGLPYNSKRSSSSVLIKSRAKKSPFVKYHVSQRMPKTA